MRKILHITAALSAAILIQPLAPSPAHAADWAKEWTLQSTRQAIRQNRDAVNDLRAEMRDSADRIIEALRMQSGENSAYQDKQIESRRRIEDAAQVIASDRLRLEFRAQAEGGEFDPAPDICLLSDLFSGETAGGEDGGGDGEYRPIGSDMASSVQRASTGGDPAVRAGGTTLARSIVDARAEHSGRMGFSDPTVDTAVLTEFPTLPAQTPEDYEAVERLTRNIVDPMPSRPITSEEMRTPEGQARAAQQTIRQTRASARGEVVAMITNMTDQVSPSQPFEAYVEDISNYNRGDLPETISELQAIDIRTLRHYAPSAEMATRRAAMSERALLQTLVDAVSIGNRIAYLQLELDRRRAVSEVAHMSTN